MADLLTKVNPGDLITAHAMNEIIDKLSDLELRLAALELTGGGTGVVIVSVTSASSPIRVTSRISVNGSGFAQPAALNAVTVGNVPISPNAFNFSSDGEHLIFDVPAIPNLSEQGTLVTLTVTNVKGTGSIQFVLRPEAQVPTGNIQLFYSSAPVMPALETNITANRSYIFIYTALTSVNLPSTYTVTPNLTGQANWTAEVLQDAVDQPRATPFSIGAGSNISTPIRVRVNVPVGAPNAAAANLMVSMGPATQGTNILPGNSGQIVITVGSPPPTPETRARVSLRSAAVNGRVQLTRNTPAGVNFNLIVTEGSATPYTLTGAFRDAVAGTVNSIPATNVPVATPQAPSTTQFTAVVNPGAQAISTDLIITVTRGAEISVQYWLPVAIN
ncbi:MAG: hypothetical protein ABI779_10385 [Acidobacteriota bacterium]